MQPFAAVRHGLGEAGHPPAEESLDMRNVNILLVSCISAAVAIGLACDTSPRAPGAKAGGIAGNLAMLVEGEGEDDGGSPPPPPADPCEGVSCEWGQVCRSDGACHSVCAPNQATCKTSESPNASYTCCARQCGATGGCDDTPPPSGPSCTGGQVACGHVCCPTLHACVNATTGQCQVDF